MWGGSISLKGWDEIEKLQKSFMGHYMAVKTTTPYYILLLKAEWLPVEYKGLI